MGFLVISILCTLGAIHSGRRVRAEGKFLRELHKCAAEAMANKQIQPAS